MNCSEEIEELLEREDKSFYGNIGSVTLDAEDYSAAFIIANPNNSGVRIVLHRFIYNNYAKEQMKASYYFYARPAGKLVRSNQIFTKSIHKEKAQSEKCRLYRGKNIVLLSSDLLKEVIVPKATTTREEVNGEIQLEEGAFLVVLITPIEKIGEPIQISFETSWCEVTK